MSSKEILTNNLDALSNSTVVSVELATLALEKGLVTQDEFEILTAPMGRESTNYTKATFLYTRMARKWTESEFQLFLSVLEQSGNGRAVEILRSSRGIDNDLIQKIHQSNGAGSFEGYLLKDELEAKQIVTELINLNQKDADASERQELFERLTKLMRSEKVWWNGSKPHLPPDYIARKVFNQTKETTLLDLVAPCIHDDPDWNKWDDQFLVLLVDSPGMGKSCALTRLEQELREKLDKSPRIIFRINLNSVGSGVGESAVENGVKGVIQELFQPLKDCSTGGRESPVYVLLDGLDEVLPQNQESVLSVIRFLLSDNSITKGWFVEKAVLTTRPHLKDLIESDFNVKAHYLVPLNQLEQVKFIQKRTGRRDARKLLNKLSSEMEELMSNPLMLSMYCSILIPSKKSDSTFDQYEIYTKFMVKKHELYVSEKIGRSYVPNRVLKQMLTSNVPFYNCVAIREILGEKMLIKVADLAGKAGKPELIQEASSEQKRNELISFGVVKIGEKLKFAHRIFAEFFYTKLMIDVMNTPRDMRNALFAFGYVKGYNVASFVLCVAGKDKEVVQFVSTGWTKFVSKGENLGRYVSKYGIRLENIWSSAIEYETKCLIFDHIMSSTIEYEGNCPGKNELIIRDVHENGVVISWLREKTNETSVRNFVLHENNTRILAAFVLPVNLHYLEDDNTNFCILRESYRGALFDRVISMSCKERKLVAEDIVRDIRHNYGNLHPLVFTMLASAFSKEELHHLIVREETRVADLIAYTKLPNASTCLGAEFLPKRLLKFRFKFGEKKGKSLFQGDFPEDLLERVWEEIEANGNDFFQDDGDFVFIRHLENNLRRYEKMGLGQWEQLRANLTLTSSSAEMLNSFLGCLLLMALNGERVLSQEKEASLVRAPCDLVKNMGREFYSLCAIPSLLPLITDLGREELLDLATIKTNHPVLLSDLPSFWELFFHMDKGLVKVSRQKALTLLNKKNVLETVVRDLLMSSDEASRNPEVELRRVFLKERGLVPEERVKKAITNFVVLPTIAQRARDLWLKDVQAGKIYIKLVVQVYMDIFKGELDPWVDKLAETVPAQLLAIAEEKVRSGGEQKWIKLLKRVKVYMRDHFRYALSLNGHISVIGMRHNRECDWYSFFGVVRLNESEEIRKKIPADYATRMKVYPTWQCSLLRVWIQLFGEEETRKQADEVFEYGCFWKWASREMRDGELLHIAVELGSVTGMKWTAWPTMLNWRDGNDRTAVEFAHKKFGSGHEVTQYLRREGDNLTEPGFFGS